MGVVVHEGHPGGLAAELEAPGHPGEAGQGGLAPPRRARPACRAATAASGGVAGVVQARDADGDRRPARPRARTGRRTTELRCRSSPPSRRSAPALGPDGDRRRAARPMAAASGSSAHDHTEPGAGHEVGEGGTQHVEGRRSGRGGRARRWSARARSGADRLEGAVALVRLDHEPLPGVPHGVGPDFVDVGTDDEGGPQAGLDQDQRRASEAVVVLPCVPGDGEAAAGGAMAASISERGTTRMPRRRASTSSAFSGCTAGE